MNSMDNLLLGQADIEVHEPRRRERPATLQIQTGQHATSKNQFRSSKAKRAQMAMDAAVVSSVSGRSANNGLDAYSNVGASSSVNTRGRIDIQLPETVVAVFPPSDLESLTSAGRRAGDCHPYYAMDTTVSTIKCVMSTVLFLAVVAAIIVVAIVKNPGM